MIFTLLSIFSVDMLVNKPENQDYNVENFVSDKQLNDCSSVTKNLSKHKFDQREPFHPPSPQKV